MPTRLNRSSFIAAVAALAGAPAAAHAASPKLRFALTFRSVQYLPGVIAQQANLFGQQGLDVETILTNSGTKAAAALASGEVDFAVMAFQHVLTLRAREQPLTAIGAMQNDLGVGLVMSEKWLAANHGATGDDAFARALKGAKIANYGPGNSGDLFMRYFLQHHGMRDTDVTTSAANDQAMIAGLQQGAFDGIMTTEHIITLAESQKLGRLTIGSATTSATSGMTGTAIGVKEDRLKSDPETVRKFLAAMSSALQMIRTDRKRTLQVTSAALTGIDPAVLATSLHRVERLIPASLAITRDRADKAQRFLRELGVLKTDIPFDVAVSNAYAR